MASRAAGVVAAGRCPLRTWPWPAGRVVGGCAALRPRLLPAPGMEIATAHVIQWMDGWLVQRPGQRSRHGTARWDGPGARAIESCRDAGHAGTCAGQSRSAQTLAARAAAVGPAEGMSGGASARLIAFHLISSHLVSPSPPTVASCALAVDTAAAIAAAPIDPRHSHTSSDADLQPVVLPLPCLPPTPSIPSNSPRPPTRTSRLRSRLQHQSPAPTLMPARLHRTPRSWRLHRTPKSWRLHWHLCWRLRLAPPLIPLPTNPPKRPFHPPLHPPAPAHLPIPLRQTQMQPQTHHRQLQLQLPRHCQSSLLRVPVPHLRLHLLLRLCPSPARRRMSRKTDGLLPSRSRSQPRLPL